MTLAHRRTRGTLARARGHAATAGTLASVRGSAAAGDVGSGGGDVTTRITTTGAVGGGRMGEAAEEIADGAREISARFSAQIPASISVSAGDTEATISSGVGPSYPNEVAGVRHPVFGPTAKRPDPPWVTNQYRPFLKPAADQRAGAAMAKYAKKIDDWAHKAGFK